MQTFSRRTFALLLTLISYAAVFGTAHLAAKDWVLQDGRTFRGDCTGAVDGQVVIKTAARREYVPLGMFSLADRDEVCAFLVAKKLKPQVVELMAFENRKTAAEERATSTDPTRPDYTGLDVTLVPGKSEPGSYDLPVPSRDLVEPAPLRDWTDITGDSLSASFEKIVPPAHVRLRGADGTVHRFALVNFVQADFAAMRAILAADADKPVFPDMPPQATGGRLWTDRRGRSMQAEFARLSGREVVLKFGTEERSFPIAGLSANDVEWIRSELQGRLAPPAASTPGSFPPRSPFVTYPGSSYSERLARIERERQEALSRIGTPTPSPPAPSSVVLRCRTCGHRYGAPDIGTPCPQCEQRKLTGAPVPSTPETPPPDRPPTFLSGRPLPQTVIAQEVSCSKCKHRWTTGPGERPTHCPNCNTRFLGVIDNSGGGGTSNSAPSVDRAVGGVIGIVAIVGTVGLIVVGGVGAVIYFGVTSSSKAKQPASRRRRDDFDEDDWD